MKIFTTTLVITSLFTALNSSAQGPAAWCGSGAPSLEWEAKLQEFIASQPLDAQKSQPQNYVIPVIVHIIHGGEWVGSYPNLSQAQVVSQIRVLNEDFGGVGYNYGNYPANAYNNWVNTASLVANSQDNFGRVKVANCQVQFCLATTDTMGNPLAEPGIERISYQSKGWQDPANYGSYSSFKGFIDNTVKPQTIWNVKKYFNIWVTDEAISSIGLLGFATFPPWSGLTGLPGSAGTSTTDGVWCFAGAFGSASTFPSGWYTSGNNRGRILTHEVGHWMGLRHVWGDANCATDYCNDTPPASASNYGAPIYPYKVGNCSNSPDGEMFMNFMDYTDDGSKYMFTADQATRVQTTMSNSFYRKFLGTHNLCVVQPVPATAQFNSQNSVCQDAPLMLHNMSSGVPVPSYSWSGSGGATFFPDAFSASPLVTFSASGAQTVTLVSNNGFASTTTKFVSVLPKPALTFYVGSATPVTTVTVCQGQEFLIYAEGGTSYTWMPNSIIDSFFPWVASQNETFTCTVKGDNGCESTGTLEVLIEDCTGLSKAGSDINVAIFPNPFSDHLRIGLQNIDEARISITDATGRILVESSVPATSNIVELKTADLPPGIYFLNVCADNTRSVTKVIKGL
jgi:hypothetical protein